MTKKKTIKRQDLKQYDGLIIVVKGQEFKVQGRRLYIGGSRDNAHIVMLAGVSKRVAQSLQQKNLEEFKKYLTRYARAELRTKKYFAVVFKYDNDRWESKLVAGPIIILEKVNGGILL